MYHFSSIEFLWGKCIIPIDLIVDEVEKKNIKSNLNRDEIQNKLNGKTLMIYFVLLNKGSIGVRELQRHLDLSSPSVARYHLDKLTELNLIENRNGEYFLLNKADIPILTSWVLIGQKLIPKVIFIATFFTLLFIGYIIFIFTFIGKDSIFVIIFAISILAYTWYDVYHLYQNKPI